MTETMTPPLSNQDVIKTDPIRDARESDLEALWALNQANLPAVSSISLEEMRWLMEHAATFRVVYVGDKLAGFVNTVSSEIDYPSKNFQWFKAQYPEFLYIDRIVITDFAQRAGLGARLYQDLYACASERGFAFVCCEYNIRPENTNSKRFHHKQGFEEVGQQEINGGEKRVSMQRKLLPD